MVKTQKGRCVYEVGEAGGVEEVGEAAAGDDGVGEAAEGCEEAGEADEDEDGVGGVGSGEREWSMSLKQREEHMKLTTLVDGL